MERWVRKKLEKCHERDADNCGICKKPYSHGEYTYTGLKNKKGFCVGECCRNKLDEIYMGGVYFLQENLDANSMEKIQSHPFREHFSDKKRLTEVKINK